MPSKKRQTLYLIDGHALAYRTYFALTGMGGDNSRWTTKTRRADRRHLRLRLGPAENPGAGPARLPGGQFRRRPTFRDELFAGLQGHAREDARRAAASRSTASTNWWPPSISRSSPPRASRPTTCSAPSRSLAAAQGADVKIITGDRDLLQLADEHITINLTGQKLSEAVDYGPAEVEAQYGLNPQQYIDYKALVGDKSDNIPGVAGVGEKTATELLQKYGTLDGIYAHLDDIPARFRSKLEAGRDTA